MTNTPDSPGDMTIPSDGLKYLSKDSSTDSRQSIASDPSTSPATLRLLSRDIRDLVRSAVGGNPATPVWVLNELSRDREKDVRRAVANNETTSPDALTVLAEDEDSNVRSNVASNPRTPQDVLLKFVREDDDDMRMRVIYNPTASLSTLVAALDAPDYTREVAKQEIVERMDSYTDDELERAYVRRVRFTSNIDLSPKGQWPRDVLLGWLTYTTPLTD